MKKTQIQAISLKRPAVILLVEDNEGDFYLAQNCLQQAVHPLDLHRVANGEECLAFLRKTGPYALAPTPDIVLLDIHMPRMDGHQVLQNIHADPTLPVLPVLVLSSSRHPDDIARAYALGCHSYFVKQSDLDRMQEMFRVICAYWFSSVRLPSRAGDGEQT